MKVTQIAEILNNTMNAQQIGESAVVETDLSNIVDIGREILDYTGAHTENYDNFVKQLINQVGKVVFRDEPLRMSAPKILKDSWEYGSVLEKVRCTLPKAIDNETWNLDKYPIMDGDKYPDPFEITKPTIDAKFFNEMVTYDVPLTIPTKLFNGSFTSASQVSKLMDMIANAVQDKRTLCTMALIQSTINGLVAQKINSNNNVVNLLELYNTKHGTTLTKAKATEDKEFLLFAAKTIAKYKSYIQRPSILYGNGGYVNQTPAERLHVVMLTDFAKDMQFTMTSGVYNKELVSLGDYEEVDYWQGSGVDDEEHDKLNVKIKNPENPDAPAVAVTQDGLVCVLFDDRGAMVCNENPRTTSNYNGRGEYTNYWYKWDARYLNDVNENCIVFVISDALLTKTTKKA